MLCSLHHLFDTKISAHKGSPAFIDFMIKKRGQQWHDDLLKAANCSGKIDREAVRIKLLEKLKCLCGSCCHFEKECIGYCGENPVVTCDLYNKPLDEVETFPLVRQPKLTDEQFRDLLCKLPHSKQESEE